MSAEDITSILDHINNLLNQIESKLANINERQLPRINQISSSFNRLERVALRYLAIVKQLGLPVDADRVLQFFTRAIVLIRQAQLAAYSLSIAMGPIGWAWALAGAGLTVVSGASFIEMAAETR